MVKDVSDNDRSDEAAVNFLEQEFIAKCSLREDLRTKDVHEGEILEPYCECVWPVPSLVRSDCLTEKELKIPVATTPYLALHFVDDETGDTKDVKDTGSELVYPSQGSPVITATLTSRKRLTQEGAKKDKYEITVNLETPNVPAYEPGDAFYFIVPNVPAEVQWLLQRLNLNQAATKPCAVNLLDGTTKKNAKVPAHLNRPCSIADILTNLVDIRGVVSKGLLRYMADACTNSEEKRRLLELVSVQGAVEFERFVRTPRLSLLDILHAFPSCMPNIDRLLEYLPPLSPRAYSVASYSSPATSTTNRRQIRVVFSLVTIPAGNGRFYRRDGLATSWLTKRPVGSQERIFLKKPTKFRLLPEHGDYPILMIGPGAGIAPFIGFLERIREEKRLDPTRFPNVWLLFGCKNEKLDFLYREELETFQSDGILSRFHASFSRDELSPCRYVHDIIRRYGEDISELLLRPEDNLRVFVCGDAKNLVNDVSKAFCDLLSTHAGIAESDARDVLKKMQREDRYLQDVWA